MTRKEDWPSLYQPQNLDPELFNWPSIDEPQTYVEKQAGRYVKVLEGLLSEALAQRNLGQAESIIVNLLRMTTVGRPRADLSVKGEPLDELDLSHVSDVELERIIGVRRVAIAEEKSNGDSTAVAVDNSTSASRGRRGRPRHQHKGTPTVEAESPAKPAREERADARAAASEAG